MLTGGSVLYPEPWDPTTIDEIEVWFAIAVAAALEPPPPEMDSVGSEAPVARGLP
jgi:hypothetical protein